MSQLFEQTHPGAQLRPARNNAKETRDESYLAIRTDLGHKQLTDATTARMSLFPHIETDARAAALRRVERRVRAPLAQRQKLQTVPVTLDVAKDYVTAHHRHHKPPAGHVFSIGAAKGGALVGVCIVGRPVSRHADDGETAEVTRLCTDGTRNACSLLYSAAARAAAALGYRTIHTYILSSETGVSLRASGWEEVGERGGGAWDCPSRPRVDSAPLGTKTLYRKVL